MGQYRQWLHYREIDQQLRKQRERLTTEVTRLQEQVHLSEVPPLDMSNPIIQALTLYAESPPASITPGEPTSSNENNHTVRQSEAISPTLLDHSRLPNLDVYEAQNVQPPHSVPATNTYAPLPPIPHSDIHLLPEDMTTSIDEHDLTDPQLDLPWWLRKVALAATQGDSLDQQSIRTNRLVQRWLERWGRQSEQAGHSSVHSTPPEQTNL